MGVPVQLPLAGSVLVEHGVAAQWGAADGDPRLGPAAMSDFLRTIHADSISHRAVVLR
ncbi:hypothetical protein D3C77_762120 [compost metagenome]